MRCGTKLRPPRPLLHTYRRRCARLRLPRLITLHEMPHRPAGSPNDSVLGGCSEHTLRLAHRSSVRARGMGVALVINSQRNKAAQRNSNRTRDMRLLIAQIIMFGLRAK
jgi:hypothetical protein